MAPTEPEDALLSGSHSFEPELTGLPPRPIPDRLGEGPYARDRRRAAVGLAVSGAAGLLLARAPGVDILARYVLPLGYLPWIGLALLALAGVAYLTLALRTGSFRYVRDGLPLAVRVVELVKTPTAILNGSPTHHAFVARVVFRHPGSGEVVRADVRSNEFPSSRRDAYDTPFRIGDTVTAVYLPGRLERTLRLYAFLELSPERHLRSIPGAGADSPARTALLVGAIAAIFLVLLANAYAFGRYRPVGFEYRGAALPMAAGGLLLGGGTLAGLYLGHRAERDRMRRALRVAAEGRAVEVSTPWLGHGAHGWALRVAVAIGASLLGAVTALCWCFLLNAWCDRSPAAPVPATVVAKVARTHALVFREYEVGYRLEGAEGTLKLLTTPEHLDELRGPEAVAHVRRGGLGWPWVATVTSR